MEITSKNINETLYVYFNGELDEHNATYTRNYLDKLFQELNFKRVVLDLYGMDFVDSTGVGVLIGRYKKLKESNRPIYISNPSTHAEKIFIMSGLYQIMPKIN